MIVGYIENWK